MSGRVIRDFLERRVMALLLGSALYLGMLLFRYDPFGDPSRIYIALFPSCWIYVLLHFHCGSGRPRVLLHLPIKRSTLARTYWTMFVGLPTAWVLALTLLAWLASSTANRADWLFVPMTAALACLVSSVFFCTYAFNRARSISRGASAPIEPFLVTWMFTGLPGMVIGWQLGASMSASMEPLPLSADEWQPKDLLVLLALGGFATIIGFARTNSLLTVSMNQPGSRLADIGRMIRRRLRLTRHLSGFAAIAAGSLWIPNAVAASLCLILVGDIWIRHLLELSPRMDLTAEPLAAALIFSSYVLCGFTYSGPRFINSRMMMSLPLPARNLGACVTLPPAALVLLQVALTLPLLHLMYGSAAMTFSLPLVGAVGVGALLMPAFLVRPQGDAAKSFAMLASLIVLFFWLYFSLRMPVLQASAPLVLAGGLGASWALASLVFRRSLGNVAAPLPLQRVSPGVAN